MTDRPPLVSLDADVWIHALAHQPGHVIADQLLRAAARGDIGLVASWLLRVELQKDPSSDTPADVVATVDGILDGAGIQWVEVDRRIALRARELSRELPRPLRSADAVHLTTAVLAGADYFMAFDRRYPFGSVIGTCAVRRPEVVWTPTLDDAAE